MDARGIDGIETALPYPAVTAEVKLDDLLIRKNDLSEDLVLD